MSETAAPADRLEAGVIHVVAGILIDAGGRLLLAQRPQGKHLAGMWEFPGGKCEPGELPGPALARELREELGIEAEPGECLIRVPWDDGGKRLRLDALRVSRWHGEPASCEGQALRWVVPHAQEPGELAPADRPILRLLCATGG